MIWLYQIHNGIEETKMVKSQKTKTNINARKKAKKVSKGRP